MCINELVHCQVGERKVVGTDNTLNGLKKMSGEEAGKAKDGEHGVLGLDADGGQRLRRCVRSVFHIRLLKMRFSRGPSA